MAYERWRIVQGRRAWVQCARKRMGGVYLDSVYGWMHGVSPRGESACTAPIVHPSLYRYVYVGNIAYSYIHTTMVRVYSTSPCIRAYTTESRQEPLLDLRFNWGGAGPRAGRQLLRHDRHCGSHQISRNKHSSQCHRWYRNQPTTISNIYQPSSVILGRRHLNGRGD